LKIRYLHTTLLLVFINTQLFAQNATLRGILLDQENNPIENATVSANTLGTVSNSNGFYILKIPAARNVEVEFSHVNYKSIRVVFNLENGQEFEFNPVLKSDFEQIETVVITGTRRSVFEGVTTISPNIIRTIKGAQPGVENLLKTLPGVNISNELSTQYSVRGGNFDENLVYVNDIEVYRPFLVRSGQQEGLSFVNTDMVENLKFSAGRISGKIWRQTIFGFRY
jgi:hypothetical protein